MNSNKYYQNIACNVPTIENNFKNRSFVRAKCVLGGPVAVAAVAVAVAVAAVAVAAVAVAAVAVAAEAVAEAVSSCAVQIWPWQYKVALAAKSRCWLWKSALVV